MLFTFLQHELKAFWRSKNMGKTIALKVIMGFLVLYLLACFLFLGFFLDKILEKAFPTDDILISFCGILLVYFLLDVLIRLQFQELPTLRVQPYLQLPIKRNTLVRYLSLTPIFSGFNLTPYILFAPFIFKTIAADNGALTAWTFLFAITAITILNNYLALYLKRKANLNGWVLFLASSVIILIAMGDFYWHLFSIRKFSYLYFGNLLTNPVLLILPIIVAIGVYYLNFLYIKQNLYLEELVTRKAEAFKSSTEFPLLNRFGMIGDLVANELKLILRNKRPRASLTMCFFFLFYGLIFYKNPGISASQEITNYSMIFAGMFMTGIFIIMYGQFMFGMQAAQFDGFLNSNIRVNDFLKAKYLLFSFLSVVFFLLSLPYALLGWKIVLVHFIMLIYNLGVNTLIILFFANRNYKRIDLSKGASFNWEGVSFTQMILGFPIMIIPFIIYIPFAVFGKGDIGLALLAITGVAFILTRNYWIKLLEKDFFEHKYKIAEGFRNK